MDKNDPPMLLPDGTHHGNERYTLILAEQTLPTKSNELTDLAREEIGTDFILDTEKPKANRIQRFFCILVLFLTLFLVYRYFPRPLTPVELKNEISFGNMDAPRSKDYRGLCSKAQKAREKGRYHECVSILEPAVIQLQKDGLHKKEVLENQLLFALYLDAVRQIKQAPSAALQNEFRKREQRAQKLVRTIIQHDPDAVQWHLLEIDLYLNRNMLAWNAAAQHNESMVKRIDEVLQMLASAEVRLKRSKIDEDEKKDNIAMLDLWRVQLLIQRWKSSAKKLRNDDYGDPGVADREKAYEIAKRYDNHLDFLKMRKYIVDMIYNNNRGYYYWNGKKYWRKKILDEERKKLDKKIKSGTVKVR